MSSSGTQVAMQMGSLASFPVEDARWYAIRTRSRCEKMVSEQLELQGIESFLPLMKRTHKWSDRTKEIELPLFSGYSFVRIDLASPERLRVERRGWEIAEDGWHFNL